MIEAKLEQMGIVLPEPPKAVANYLPYVQTGNLLYLSGALPLKDGKITHEGKVGKEFSIEEGQEAARVCGVNLLTNMKAAVGELEKVKRVVFVSGFVNGVDGFAQSPAVINGVSDMFGDIFGEAGRHSRAAVSVNGLPLNAAVEVQCVVEVE